ncbi:hypothetical protein BH09ACT1_BH09ACT1_05310 [soil metagenome]
MGSVTSTTVVLVGGSAPQLLGTLGQFANVRAASLADASEDEARTWTAQARAPYVVHDRDPLEHVAAAWVEFFDDLTTIETLDLEVERAASALASGALTMPDYYVVVDPDLLSPTWKHWWLGVLAIAAPSRVIPWDDGSSSIARVLRRLPTGRAWPKPRPWLQDVARSVPDRIGL